MTQNQYGGNLTDKPHLIFNCDESGFELDAINKIVAAARGAKHVPRISKGQHEKITVMACSSAAGNSLPPMFIYKSLSGRLPNGVKEGAPEGTLFVAQKSGWIDKDLYLQWFKELFLRPIPSERPVLLIMDGHKSHVTEDLILTAAENKILVFCLPAHASHLLQPLDLSLSPSIHHRLTEPLPRHSHRPVPPLHLKQPSSIHQIADRHAPLIQKRVRGLGTCKWMNGQFTF